MPLNEKSSVDYCLDCFGKMAIRCARCGGLIFIGDPITFFTPRKNRVPGYAVIYGQDPLQLISCLRCIEIGVAGFWLPDESGKRGKVWEIQTAPEMPASEVLSEGTPDSGAGEAIDTAPIQPKEERHLRRVK